MLHKYQVVAMVGLFLVAFIFSGAVFAHFSASQEVTGTKPMLQPKVEAVSTSQPVETPVLAPVQPQPCTKTVTEDKTTSGSNVINTSKTEVTCNSVSNNGSSSVNITSDSTQSAQSGDSTGQSGSASNSNSTDVTVN